MARDMTLYWSSGSPPGWRVMIVLEEKNLHGYTSKQMSYNNKDHKGPEMMSINPRGQFPAFKHGDIVINESIAICEYLEDQFKSQGNVLMPEEPAERAMVLQRMNEANSLMKAFTDIALYTSRVPEDERHDSAVKRNHEALSAEILLWEDHVEKSKGQFIAGKTFTLADAVLFPVVAMIFRVGLSEKKHPRLAGYYNHVKEHPSVQKTWPPTWKDTQGQTTLKDI